MKWRTDIDNAPRNTPVLARCSSAFSDHSIYVARYFDPEHKEDFEEWDIGWETVMCKQPLYAKPTHWMPLPEPPEVER